MNFYEVRYRDDNVGCVDVIVIAKDKKAAVKLAIKECKIPKWNQNVIIYSAKTKYRKGLVIL